MRTPGPYHYPCETHAGSTCPDCDGTGLVSHEGDAHELSRESAIAALDHEIQAMWRGLDRTQRAAHVEAERTFDRSFFGYLGIWAASEDKAPMAARYRRCAALCEVIVEADELRLRLAASVHLGAEATAADKAALASIRPVQGGYEGPWVGVVVDPVAAFQVALKRRAA